MKSATKTLFSTLFVTALLPIAAMAQSYPNQGYWVDGSGSIVTSSTSGLCWHSGEWTPALAVAPCDPTISRVAAAPAPQAAQTPVAAAPAALVPAKLAQKVSFSADALFAFNKSALKPEGKVMLDDLARQLNGAEYDMILVTGHADRIGGAAYNQKLSVQRAEEVKAYLVGKNIPVGRINATGQGETQPMTKTGECVGAKSAKLIACLQPDRRVDVEMTGTKQN